MLTYDLRDRGGDCLYEHLYRCVRADIESGAIAPGEHLPSKRALARQLGVSLVTVEGAYAQLIAEGYVRALPRRGYYACELPRPSGLAPRRAAASPAQQARGPSGPGGTSQAASSGGGAPSAEKPPLADFTTGAALFDEAAVRMWGRAVRGALEEGGLRRELGAARPEGLPGLRASIARHLRGFRGMDVNPDCVVIGAGAQALYPLVVQLLGREGAYAVEDPGYRLLAQVYAANGAVCRPVPLGPEGIDTRALEESGAAVAHVMPSHQFPCGTVTSIGRRYQLLAWANGAPRRLVVEDDYDAEFRLAGRPVPSLASMDAAGKVIYLNTFSKSLGPALRVAYMVLPSALMRRFRERRGLLTNTVSALDQASLARLIDSGDYERHLARFRTRHRARRDALAAALRAADPGGLMRLEEADSGLHFVLAGPELPDPRAAGAAELAAAEAARRGGVVLDPLSSHAFSEAGYAAWQGRAAGGPRARFVMRYASVAEEAMPDAARVIVAALLEADG